ncbi:ATP-binding response regulator [Methylobacterium gnaphalii]|uniref:histidine kinase n=1 Tax=Methylobacterium gnaphalii TaxID=1010610 RepID=A0A512JQC7_9HYPH|nr:DUF3369 domain-containing protein [Methylobacterium gnaphalii]GEP12152.1 histidine kinase [Methylobacterium gnaphalii]GJD70016.1 Adaptive-response sensory-kinase SasA [Methylobacterium gnaphalii]GLS48911.1 histidine kinase [Methylobacterium gnaphalii]
MDDDLITLVADDIEDVPAPSSAWVVAVIDDDPAVHEGTRYALSNFMLDGRGLEILSAYSAREARALLADRRDVAVIMLDVVMETDDAGLLLVDYIRRELCEETARIILRTGQPGQAPERRIIVDYDINDYKAKTELTADKLFTSLTASLRAFQQLKRLDETRRGLEIIIDAAPMLLDHKSMQRLAEGVLTQVASLLNVAVAGILVLRESEEAEARFCVLAGSGCYGHYVSRQPAWPLGQEVHPLVEKAFAERSHTFGDHWSTLYVHTSSGSEIVALIEADRALSETDRALIALFTSRLSIAFDNVILYEKLQRANTDLEQRVIERTAELIRANRRLAMQRSDLRRANSFKTEILGTVAHDLKNPLSVILGRAEMLADIIEIDATAPEKRPQMRAQVEHIRTSTKRLTAMIDSLMADAMNDAHDITLRREPVDLAALAREVCDANRPLAGSKGQSLVYEGPDNLYLCGDTERLREALDNLVSNAVKYSALGGEIRMRVSRETGGPGAAQGPELVCAVADNGPGLSPEDATRVFGRFQRLSAKPTAGEGSTGLGLSIVRRIAELHGGRATAESDGPGQGAVFAVRFPEESVALL